MKTDKHLRMLNDKIKSIQRTIKTGDSDFVKKHYPSILERAVKQRDDYLLTINP